MHSAEVWVAIALSGGVDSAVAALFLKRCVPRWCDVEALWGAQRALTHDEVRKAIEQRRPFFDVVGNEHIRKTGYDSAVAIKYFPFFMRNWEDSAENSENNGGRWCATAEQDYNDATDVARAIGLLRNGETLSLYNYSASYVENCFEPMLSAYARGETLNVDVLCNQKVKFDALLNMLLETKKAQYLATGHYARTVYISAYSCNNALPPTGRVIARPFSSGQDLNDQTVFLSRLSRMQTLRAIFPLGHVFQRKTDVRAVAVHFGLVKVSKKKTSKGLCFVGEHYKRLVPSKVSDIKGEKCRDTSGFSFFLEEYIAPNTKDYQLLLAAGEKTRFVDASSGNVIDASVFEVLDKCAGGILPAHRLTIGQMIRGKDEGGKLTRYYVQGKKLFPLQMCVGGEESCVRYLHSVLLVDRWDHPLLFGKVARLRDVAFLLHPLFLMGRQEWEKKDNGKDIQLRCRCCARHQEPLRPATLCFARCDLSESAGGTHVSKAIVIFDEPVRALTSGQALVAYRPLAVESAWDAVEWFVLASGWIV